MAFNTTFSKLSRVERQSLVDTGERRRFKPGQVIIKQGTQLKGVYVIIDGEVRVEHGFNVMRNAKVKGPDGKERVERVPGRLSVEVTRLGRGAIFGEMSFIDDALTSASVSAIDEVATVFIDAGTVHGMLDKDPGFAARFYHSLAIVLSKRLREANKRARGGKRPASSTAKPAAKAARAAKA